MWSEVVEILLRSLAVSGAATLLAASWSVPAALALTISDSRVSRLIQDVLSALIGVPTVVLGLFLYQILSRSGPLGFLRILYTPVAIAFGQALLVTPLIIAVAASSLAKVRERVWEVTLSLGATEHQAAVAVAREGLPQLLRGVLLSFNRAIGELGVALMVGGNIGGYTRVMTTAIALGIMKGEYELALSLGVLLLVTSTAVTIAVRVAGGVE